MFALTGCEDAEQRRARYAEKKPAPKPLERKFVPPPAPEPVEKEAKPVGPAMIEYQGDDITQITGLSGKKVMLVFYAPWCTHCAEFKNTLVEYAMKEKGQAYIVAIDADKHPGLAQEYGVEAIPKTVLFVEGMRLRDIVGNISTERLTEIIDKTLEAGEIPRT